MKITLTTVIETNEVGTPTITTKIKVKDVAEGERAQITWKTNAWITQRRPMSQDPASIEVTDAMKTAARQTFLTPDRVLALGETLSESYRAMERVRRAKA